MNNAISMSAEFERQKNAKAFLFTGLISASIVLLIWAVSWPIPTIIKETEPQAIEIFFPPEPPDDDVNLGNNDVGSGNVQPIVTGTPSSNPVSQETTPSKGASTEQTSKDFEEDNNDKSPDIVKPSAPTTSKEITKNASTQTVTATKPDPKPKALMTSTRGSGNGGNTDLPGYNKPGGQGPGDGAGDKGVQNGNPNGRRYIGTNVYNIKVKDFEDEFKEGGKIALDIEVDGNGKLVSAVYQPRGSSLPKSSQQYSIAITRAREIGYPKYEGGFKETRVFKFTVQ